MENYICQVVGQADVKILRQIAMKLSTFEQRACLVQNRQGLRVVLNDDRLGFRAWRRGLVHTARDMSPGALQVIMKNLH